MGSGRVTSVCRHLIMGGTMVLLVACTPGDYSIGSRSFSWPFGEPGQPQSVPNQNSSMLASLPPQSAPQSFGRGSVKVALLLPLTGDPSVSSIAGSMANGARLAMNFIEANPNIAENTTIILRDTGGTANGAAQAASQAVGDGASLILGPLKGEEVMAAGGVARSAGIPLIGFSNNATAASPGVYLLSVLPEAEMRRSLGYLKNQGKRGFAGAFPNSDFGRAQENAYRQMAAAMGITPVAVFNFSTASEARTIVDRMSPLLQSGQIDALYLPDRASAPSFGAALQQAGVSGQKLAIVGSADWEGDPAIAQAPSLNGALYPAVDEAGLRALSADYAAQFGGQPHPLATLAYTATILANAKPLSMATPRYNAAQLTAASGFNGRDGVFRFLSNGRSEYALAIRQISNGTSVQVDGARL